MRSVRLSRRAVAAFRDIREWSSERFGARQTTAYLQAMRDRVGALATGEVSGRSCAVLAGPIAPAGYGYLRAGSHYLICAETADTTVLLDILHQSVDLPARIAALDPGA